MRVAADLHHGVLWEALSILIEDRAILGPAELVAVVDGYYQKEPGAGVADFPPRVPVIVTESWLMEHGADIVIATTATNRSRFRTLADRLGALYVDQVGNQWDGPIGRVVLRSVAGEYGIAYHPEFHRVPWKAPTGDVVGSFHASFEHSPCRDAWDRSARPSWRMYGRVEDPLYPWQVAAERAGCAAIWHCKDADGYGFGVHEAFASGRPVIGHAHHYEGKLAAHLFQRGVTYIEPDDDIGALLGDPERLARMGAAAALAFREHVDFDAEAIAIGAYLEAHR